MGMTSPESHLPEAPLQLCKGAGGLGWGLQIPAFHMHQDGCTFVSGGGRAHDSHTCDPQAQVEDPSTALLTDLPKGGCLLTLFTPFSTWGLEPVAETCDRFSASANRHNLWAHFSDSSFRWGKEPSNFVCVCVCVCICVRPVSVLKCSGKRVLAAEMHFHFKIKANRH